MKSESGEMGGNKEVVPSEEVVSSEETILQNRERDRRRLITMLKKSAYPA